MSERPTSLASIEAACWLEMARAVRDKAHPWRTPVLATVAAEAIEAAGADGAADPAQPGASMRADARLVVLRALDADRRELLIYTDARAGKVAQLRRQGLGMLVLWSPSLAWQLRLSVDLSVNTSGLDVASRWARLKLSPAAQDYLSPLPPGAPTGGAPDPASWPQPDRGTLGHFAVIAARVCAMDWLELTEQGQRRAVFDADGARWVQP
jgi:hypothetical protein